MMKRCIAMILLGLWVMGGALAEAAQPSPTAGNTTAIPNTDYQITLPEGWQTATQPDTHRAVVEAVNPSGNLHILVFVNSQPDWNLDDWKSALTKGSQTSSVTDICEQAISGRQWVTYRLTLDHTKGFAAATDIGGGLFVTLEFRVADGDLPEAVFPQRVIDVCLASLQPLP